MNNNIVEKHQVVIQWFQKIHKGDHMHCGQHYTWGQRVYYIIYKYFANFLLQMT